MMSLDKPTIHNLISNFSNTNSNDEHHEPRIELNRANVFSAAGTYKYSSSDDIIIIIFDAVRSLKWTTNGSEVQNTTCAAGTIFYVPANVQLTLEFPDPTERLYLYLNTMEQDAQLVSANNAPYRTAQKLHCKDVLTIAKIIRTQLQKDVRSDDIYLGALFTVVANLIKSVLITTNIDQNSTGLNHYAAHHIENFLKQNFHRPISVPEMADLLGISTGHFATSFRQTFGQSPHQFLLGLKLDEAQRCLLESNRPIQRIAADLGFSSQSHLTTALRKYRQATPGELRRRRHLNGAYKPN